jgi:N-acetylneuraminate synthase
MNKKISINGRLIGEGQAPYIVAEVSANHNGSLDRAKEIMFSAKSCGADAIKLQTYTADTITIKSDHDDFLIKGGLWDGKTLYDLYKWAETPFEWHKPLFDYARSIDLTCFSTPFDESAVDLLEDLNAPAYKIASFEAVDIPLIKCVASTKKPMIISTGMANLEEISEAVEAAKSSGCQDLILLHCISSYPAPANQSNLRTIQDLSKKFDVITGLSDHTLGTTVSVASVALGASFIEKHFTLSRNDEGPDSSFSIEPGELSELCRNAKTAWDALGVAGYQKKSSEEGNIQYRRSLYFVNPLQAGEVIKSMDIRSIRPGHGLAPKYMDSLIGREVTSDISFGEPVSWDLIK